MPHSAPSSRLALLSALVLATTASAQTLAPAPAAPATPAKPVPSDAVMLSPFEVSSERDTGFAAASSLAGGRLAGDLRDTPVAYSVITRDFIDALGITDLQTAAEWTTASTLNVDNGMQNFFAAPINYTTRGTGNTRPQRNFFPQYNNGDSYNLERYDFGRGPNSILFGNGSLSGVSSSTTKRAQTSRPSESVQLSVGSWRNYRATIDANQPLSDKVAVRTSAVWGDSSGWRLKDFDKRKAAFLTTTFKPFKQTEIRVEGEYGIASRQSGFTTLDVTATDRQVGGTQGLHHVVQGQFARLQPLNIDQHLKLLQVATHRVDLDNAWHGAQLRRNLPIQ